MSFGLDENGFTLKRLDDIKTEIEAELRAAFGNGINLAPESVLGQMVGVMAEREASVWELAEDVYNSQYPDSSAGVPLDNVVAITAISRLGATNSLVTLRVKGTPATAVPIGFIGSVDANAAARFVTVAGGNISATGIDEVQDITFTLVPDSGSWSLDFDGQDTGPLVFNITAGALEAALEGLSNIGVGNVLVAGDFTLGFTITFQAGLGEVGQNLLVVSTNTLLLVATPVVTTVTETTEGFPPFIDLACEAEDTGPVSGPARSITTIETPIVGVASITNLLDADLGRNTETDSELKIRRAIELAKAGTATVDGIRNALLTVEDVTEAVINENTTSAPVGGVPAHGFEAVVEGGVEQGIADKIFDSKAAGIETGGVITKVVTDDVGGTHNISFSRPTEIEIHVIANIIGNINPVEGDLYPSNGDQLVEDAILAFGNALRIGQDVINNSFYSPVNLVPGVIGVELLMGTAPAPTLENNIAISSDEVARFDTSRITVVS